MNVETVSIGSVYKLVNYRSPKCIRKYQKTLIKEIIKEIRGAKEYKRKPRLWGVRVFFAAKRGFFMHDDEKMLELAIRPLIEEGILKHIGLTLHQGEKMPTYEIPLNWVRLFSLADRFIDESIDLLMKGNKSYCPERFQFVFDYFLNKYKPDDPIWNSQN